MDTELLVDDRVEGGREILAQLARDGFAVTVACWVRAHGTESWYLYLGSDSVNPEKVGDAYGSVYASLYKLPDPWVSLSDMKLLNTSDPIAHAAIAVRDRYPGRIPTRYHGKRLGSLAIEEAYIYPRAGAMTSKEVLQTVAALMNRTGVMQPSIISFIDGTSVPAIPVGLNMQVPGGVRVVYHEIASGANREVAVENVLNIQ